MAGSFGGAVKLSGENEYKKALQNITNELKIMANQMKAVTSVYGQNDTSVVSLTEKDRILNTQIGLQTEKILGLNAQIREASQKYGENSTQVNALKEKLNLAHIEMTGMDRELANNKKALDDATKGQESLNNVSKTTINSVKDFASELLKGVAGVSNFGDVVKKDMSVRLEEAKEGVKNTITNVKGLGNTLLDNIKHPENLGKAIKDSLIDTADKLKNSTKESSNSIEKMGKSEDDTADSTLKLGDIIKANLISEAIIGGVKALASAVVGMGKSFAGALSDGVKYNSMIEDYTMSFQTMTGSADKAQEMMNEIKKTAKETPFEIDGMADSVKQMMAYGIEGNKSIELTKLLGDVSQGNMEKMNNMAYAMGQISSAGKLNGQDLRQLINAGFNPLEEISLRTGESMESLKDKMSKGLITYQDVEDSLKAITGEGGRFENAMINASKTFSGQTDMMKEGWANFKGILASGVTDLLANTVMPAINGVLDSGQDLLTAILGGDEAQIQEAQAKLTENVTTLVQSVADQLPALLETFGSIIQNLLPVLQQALPQVLQIALQIIPNIVGGIIQALPSLVPVVLNIVTSLVDLVVQNLPMILETGIQVLVSLVERNCGCTS